MLSLYDIAAFVVLLAAVIFIVATKLANYFSDASDEEKDSE